MIDSVRAAVAVRVGQEKRHADPLQFRRMSSVQQREAIESVVRKYLTYWHSGNAGAKTSGFAHVFIAMCRGLTRIDGRLMHRPGTPKEAGSCPDPECDLEDCPGRKAYPAPDPADDEPYWITLPGLKDGARWRHWVLVNSYDQAKDSSVAAYRKLIGRHPHKIEWLRAGIVKRIYIRPDGWTSDDYTTWSEITWISQEGMTEEDVKYVQGARIDSAHFDEMPKQAVFEEVCSRADANEELYLAIGATPEYVHEWQWCWDHFLGCYRKARGGRIRLQSSVEDNRALSPKGLHDRWKLLHDSKLFKARWNGEHVNVAGGCPFPDPPMDRMLDQCEPGRLVKVDIRVPMSPDDEDYRDILPASAVYEKWMKPNSKHWYLLIGDTSRGIEDGSHDPSELQLWDWTEPMVCARFGMRDGEGGFLDEDSLALLAFEIATEYEHVMIDCEVTGNFGVEFFRTLRKKRWKYLAHDDLTLRPGETYESYGWTANETTNGEIVTALQNGLNGGTFKCWSADMVRQWKDVREDERGKASNVRKGARHHRESMVCAGRALHWIATRRPPRFVERPSQSGMRAALQQDFGRPIPIGNGSVKRKGGGEIYRDYEV